jgi:uncharacterized protein YceK
MNGAVRFKALLLGLALLTASGCTVSEIHRYPSQSRYVYAGTRMNKTMLEKGVDMSGCPSSRPKATRLYALLDLPFTFLFETGVVAPLYVCHTLLHGSSDGFFINKSKEPASSCWAEFEAKEQELRAAEHSGAVSPKVFHS